MMTMMHQRLLLATILGLLLVMTFHIHFSQAVPILGQQTEFEDNSKVQGRSKPIFVYCDEIGNHLNCMLFCKNLGHMSGHCGGDFICSCF